MRTRGVGKAAGPTGAVGRVTRLWIYPVKGARGIALDRMDFGRLGPRGDRRWMVVRPDGNFVSQRDVPRMATIRPSLEGAGLRLDAGASAEPLLLDGEPDGEVARVRIHGSETRAVAARPEADRWLSEALDADVRLVFMRADQARPTDPAYAPDHRVGFADGYPALVVSEASVEELARRARRAIPVERFRPNVVVTADRPHDEDRWQRFSAGAVSFRGVKMAARCSVTTVDQETGRRDPDSEPLRALARYRRLESAVYFGVNAVHLGPGRVRVGDEVRVQRRGWIPGETR